jgi:hypothetical protein
LNKTPICTIEGDINLLRAGLQTDKGPIGLIGINDENLLRMKAGMPLDIDLKAITPPGKRMTQVVIHYAPTYEEIIDDWEKGGLPVNEVMRQKARELDEQLAREKRENPS